MEVSFLYREVCPSEVCSSVVFRTFTEVCDRLHCFQNTFISPKETLWQPLPTPPPPQQQLCSALEFACSGHSYTCHRGICHLGLFYYADYSLSLGFFPVLIGLLIICPVEFSCLLDFDCTAEVPRNLFLCVCTADP